MDCLKHTLFFFFFGPCSNRCTYTRNTHTQTQKQNYNASLYSPLFPFFFCFFSFFFFGVSRCTGALIFFFCARLFLPTLFPLLFSKGMERRGGGCQRKTLAKGRDRRSMNAHDRNSRSCADRPFFFLFFFFCKHHNLESSLFRRLSFTFS